LKKKQPKVDIRYRISPKVDIRWVKLMLSNFIHRNSPTCLWKLTFDDIFHTPTEVDFRTQQLQKSSLFYGSHSSLIEITHLLRKSLISYGSHIQLRKSPTKVSLNYRSRLSVVPFSCCSWWSTEVHFRNLSWSTEVHFRHLVAYGSWLPELNHLRKLIFGLWFMFQA